MHLSTKRTPSLAPRTLALVAATGLGYTVGITPANAAPENEDTCNVEDPVAEAERRVEHHEYGGALECMQRDYARSRNPYALWNMAVVFDNMGDLRNAYNCYREYIRRDRALDLDARRELLSKVERYADQAAISEDERDPLSTGGVCSTLLMGLSSGARLIAPTPTPVPTPAPAPAPTADAPEAPPVTRADEPLEIDPYARRDRRTGAAMLVTGTLALAGAGVMGGLAGLRYAHTADTTQKLENAEYPSWTERNEAKDAAASLQLEAVAFVAGASASLVTAAILLGVGGSRVARAKRAERDAWARLGIAPTLGRSTGLAITGRF